MHICICIYMHIHCCLGIFPNKKLTSEKYFSMLTKSLFSIARGISLMIDGGWSELT